MRRYGPEFPDTLFALAQRGEILATRGKLEEARSVLAPLPDAYARVFGPDHFQRGKVLRNYGLVLEATGDLDRAQAKYRQSLAIHLEGDRRPATAPARGHAPPLRGPRRIDPRPRRRRRDVSPADPAAAAKTRPLSVPADRLAGALADALADRGDPKAAIELLKAVHNRGARLEPRLDWLLPHLRSMVGGYELRLGDRGKATTNLRTAVEQMEKTHLKPPAPVLAAARAACSARRGERRGQGPVPDVGALRFVEIWPLRIVLL